MSDARAILAEFTDFKRVATRNTFQLIFELPLEQAEEAIKLLGNPLPGKTLKCGIARVAQRKEQDVPNVEAAGSTPAASAKEKTKWQKLRPSAQAALRCADTDFGMFAADEYPASLTKANGVLPTMVRAMCGVHSRAELDSNDSAAAIWAEIDAAFVEWLGTLRAQQQHEAYAR